MKSRINRDEREISVSELCWYIISKWKVLVIGMVVGALLLGAYGAYKAFNDDGASTTMENLTPEEQEEVQALIEDYEFYESEVERIDNNYLMNLDYNYVYRCLLTYYIDTDYSYNYMEVQENYATELVSMYKTYVLSEEVRNKIMELNIEGLESIDLSYILNTSNEGNIIKIAVYASKDECVEIAGVLCEAIEEYYDVATEYVGTHKLIQISYDTIEVYNENIKNRQSMLTSYTKGLLDKITATKTTMSKSQVSAFEKAIADIDETSDSTSSSDTVTETITSLVNKKYIVMGAFCGIVVAAVIIIVLFMAGKKIKSVSELDQVYGVEVLGKVLKDNTSCKYAMKKINKISTNEAEAIQKKYVTETILNKCNQNGITEVAFCSTVSGLTEEFADTIKVLKDAGISSKCATNINNDSEALNAAVASKNVIIIEKLNVTTKNNISAEVETCDKLDINIVGMVAIV